jgi:hypothetical protein
MAVPALPPPTVAAVVARLQADPDLMAVLAGGVWGRDLKREGSGATPDAFAPEPPHTPRPAAVVVDDGEGDDLLGPPAAQLGFLSVWFYAVRTGSGRDAVNAAVELTRRSLVNWTWPTPNLTPATIATPGMRLGVRDDPVDGQRLLDRLRFPYVAVWRLD